MRKPFKKNIKTLPIEEAHAGSGKRQLILSKKDPISGQLEAMTKGYLGAGAAFDWHTHQGIDEFFIVLKGKGVIFFEDGTLFKYKTDDLIYIPADIKHKIEAAGNKESQFYFIRIKE